MPCHDLDEPRVGLRLDRFDLATQHGQRPPAQLAQHVDIAVLATDAARAELAVHDAVGGLERGERADDALDRRCEAAGDIGRGERAVGAGVAGDQRLQRMGDRLGERQRQTERDVAAERVAVPGGIFGSDEPRLATELDLDRPPRSHEVVDPLRPAGALAAQIDLGSGEVADLAQHVVQLVGTARPAAVGDTLQLQLDVGEHTGIEQLAQLLGTEQIAQQIAIERQRRGAALGQRRVALVHVRGDPVEQQALGERRRLGACRR